MTWHLGGVVTLDLVFGTWIAAGIGWTIAEPDVRPWVVYILLPFTRVEVTW